MFLAWSGYPWCLQPTGSELRARATCQPQQWCPSSRVHRGHYHVLGCISQCCRWVRGVGGSCWHPKPVPGSQLRWEEAPLGRRVTWHFLILWGLLCFWVLCTRAKRGGGKKGRGERVE